MAINHAVFQGRLIEPPKCGQTNNGTDYANFRLAWNRKYKDTETKCFLDCKAFGNTAKFIGTYMNQKGQEIIAEGELNTDEWEKDGQKRSKVSLLVERTHFCGKKQDGDIQPNLTPVNMGDELPF